MPASTAITANVNNAARNGMRVRLRAILAIASPMPMCCPRPWAQERYRRIVRWGTPERGGHFPSMEVPDLFVDDLRDGLAAVLAARADWSM